MATRKDKKTARKKQDAADRHKYYGEDNVINSHQSSANKQSSYCSSTEEAIRKIGIDQHSPARS